MERCKLLSVLISNYNHAEYIGGALASIEAQKYTPMELIIIDDASTDNSVDVIESSIKNFDNVRFIKNEQNRGIVVNNNRLLQLSQGEYVYWLASDDRILPGFFEKTLNVLNNSPQAGLCWVDTIFINENDQKIGEDRFHLSSIPKYFPPDEIVEILRKKMLHIGGLNSIYRRSALIESGGAIPELKSYSDFFLILSIAFRHGICYVPESLVVCRFQKGQYSAKLLKNKKVHSEIIRHILNLLNSPSYKDVRHHFKESLVLSYLFSPVISLLLRNRDFRYFLSLKLYLRTYWRTIKKKINPYLPISFKNIYYYIRNVHNKHIFGSRGQ